MTKAMPFASQKQWIKTHPRRSVAIGIGIVILLLLLLGGGGDDLPAASDAEVKLKVAERRTERYQRQVVVYGQTEAFRDVNLQAQTAGEVTEIVSPEGSRVEAGDIILKIDPRERLEQLKQAEAVVKQRSIEYEAARKLTQRGYQSEVNLALAEANLAQARAQQKQIQLDVGYTEMKAPFAGIVDRVNVEAGDFVGVGVFGLEGSVARMIDPDPMLVTAYVSQDDWAEIVKDTPVTVTLPGNREAQGTLHFIARAAEAASRTFKVEATLPNPEGTIPSGVTAELHIPANAADAYLVPPSALSLDDAGAVGIKALDAENTVRFYPVTMLDDTAEGMWVTGAPSHLRLILEGAAYVSTGQTIPADRVAEGTPAP
ncbi:MAG: hypothetical protein CMM93_03545 [Rickettsiales bacterium]|nr:hypothetical protein [Rickettsiales bacterium]|tara:strand:- start:2408 stop:3523 length:1116 start_codon:yes stop_codon:yes gene_type:complete